MTAMVEDNSASAPARTDLSDLLRERRAELRRSLTDVTERTGTREDGTPFIKRSTLDNLEKASPRMQWTPRLPELEALARAYDLPLQQVRDAAGRQYWGVDRIEGGSGGGSAYLRDADKLTPQELEQIQRLIDLFANRTPGGTLDAQE
ncbi:helix-turn-helix domain-containing protein [Streptomyces sp. PCS3-D2]|uniref:helix-turn-helix domain-containing protein n=1 Tax=Streptomyces sp. PCS3-D2 TaxID=1460244 RepID=UPI000447DC27|nr:helix-turn-helix domain-containing protein [Streptomyces sp. PCS3-D2]WKV74763.1 helix-turn-helix domain-containing protein [Streptomyces sp. PCS3-D2]